MEARSTSRPLIGRDEDLEVVLAAVSEASAGRPRVVVVAGEAGIGKSRLVREVADRVRAQGDRVLSGGCLDIGDGGLPYLPVAEAIRGLIRDTSDPEADRLLGPAREDVELLLPGLLAVTTPASASADDKRPPDPEPPPFAGGFGQARLFERLLGLVGRLGAAAPTLLVIEDVHWIDRATRDLLTFLLRNLTDERLAIVLTCRIDDLPRGHAVLAWLAEIGRSPHSARVDLERLDRAAVVRQLHGLSGRTPDPASAERIWRRSEGNPLFVEELSSALLRGEPEDQPASVVEILLARVSGLSREAGEVLAAVAIAGRPVDEALIVEVLAWPEAAFGRRCGRRSTAARSSSFRSPGSSASGTSCSARRSSGRCCRASGEPSMRDTPSSCRLVRTSPIRVRRGPPASSPTTGPPRIAFLRPMPPRWWPVRQRSRSMPMRWPIASSSTPWTWKNGCRPTHARRWPNASRSSARPPTPPTSAAISRAPSSSPTRRSSSWTRQRIPPRPVCCTDAWATSVGCPATGRRPWRSIGWRWPSCRLSRPVPNALECSGGSAVPSWAWVGGRSRAPRARPRSTARRASGRWPKRAGPGTCSAPISSHSARSTPASSSSRRRAGSRGRTATRNS